MELEARRLTGPGWLLSGSGAALHVPVVDRGAAEAVAQALARGWKAGLTSLQLALPELAWPVECKWHAGESSLAFAVAAPWDVLDLAVDWLESVAIRERFPADAAQRLQETANPSLRRWLASARQQGVPVLLDEERLTAGLGASLVEVDPAVLPDLAGLAATALPIALVTGTNGKTTTSRLLTRMLRTQGYQVGSTSTDGWTLNEALQEAGDWTGPGGARKVLRQPEVTAAVLETARGGLLRRGLALAGGAGVGAQVAVVTSLASDHLGEWGADTLDDLAAVKLSIAKGLRDGGLLVLHAASPALVETARRLRAVWRTRGLRVAWFAESQQAVEAVTEPGDGQAWLAGGALHWRSSEAVPPLALAAEAEVALSLGGLARHNLSNALAASVAALELGIGPEQVRQTLRSFGNQPSDNPGRLGCWNVGGALAMVDFAHNPEGMQRMVEFALAVRATRRWLVFGQAGDRSLRDLAELVQAALPLQPAGWLIKDTVHYLRGRNPGDVPEILRALLLKAGVDADRVATFANEHDAVDAALKRLQPDDLLLLLVHDDAQAVELQLQRAGAVPWQGPLPQAGRVA